MAREWRKVTIESIASRIAMGPFGSDIKTDNFVPSGVPVIRGNNLARGRFRGEEFVFLTEEKADDLANANAFPGDLVFTHRGTLGQVGLIPPKPFERYVVSQSQMKLTCDPDRADALFIYYFFTSSIGQHALLMNTSQTGVPAISRPATSLKAVQLALPSLPEQRAIAHILGTLDDKIELNWRMSETLEAMARALFKSWFVDFDPVRAKAEGRKPSGMDAETAKLFPSELRESELGEIPRGWRATTLGAEAERCGGIIQTGPFGSQLHASDYVSEGIPVVMPKDISARRVSTTDVARVREHDAERLSRHRLLVGDIVYSRRGDVERHARIGERETGWLCGTGCLLVRLGPTWPSPLFASLALDRPETRAWIVQHAIGATMPNLNTGILAAVPLVVPPDGLIAAFARAADQLQALVVARDLESATLLKTRDALLPRLLSGELSVAQAEQAKEATA